MAATELYRQYKLCRATTSLNTYESLKTAKKATEKER